MTSMDFTVCLGNQAAMYNIASAEPQTIQLPTEKTVKYWGCGPNAIPPLKELGLLGELTDSRSRVEMNKMSLEHFINQKQGRQLGWRLKNSGASLKMLPSP